MRKFFLLSLASCSLLLQQPVLAQREHLCAGTRVQQTSRQALAVASQVHQRRMQRYDVSFHHLDLALERTTTYVRGSVRTLATVTAPLDTFSFELHPNLSVDSLRLNGQRLAVQRSGGEANVRLTAPLPAGTRLNVVIYYKGLPPSGASAAIGNGMTNASSPSWGNQVTWSLSQPFSAYEWWPCKQDLTDKADSSYVFVTTDAANKAGSNGLLTATVSLPGNKKRYEWKSRYPIDYYLISVAVAEYVDYSIYAHPAGSPQPVLIQNFVYNNPQTLPFWQSAIDETAGMLELFSDTYSLYPFWQEKYGHCMAPLGGGMEHQTMTTQGTFGFTLTAHELAHQWFGDNVTCRSWAHIWLNEGFASYSEYVALENLHTQTEARQWMDDTHSSIMSQPGGSVYVADSTNNSRIFSSRLTYDKGAALAHMLRFWFNNDSLFFRALQTYQQTYAGRTARTADLQQVLENASGLSLGTFFSQWFYGEGYPTFAVRWNQTGSTLSLQATQTTSMPAVTPLFQTPLEYSLSRAGLPDTTIRLLHNQSVEQYSVPVTGTVTGLQLDPDQWVLNRAGAIVKDPNLVVILANGATAEKAPVRAYPNPFTHTLQLENLPFAHGKLTLFDICGKVTLQQVISGPRASLETGALPQGVYTVRLTDGKQVEWLKVIK